MHSVHPFLMKEAKKSARRGVIEKAGRKFEVIKAKKSSPESTAELAALRSINVTVEKMFTLVKKELDNLRRKELPASLTEPKASGNRPFKF